MTRQDTLQQRISDNKKLSDNEIDELVDVICSGCQTRTRERIRRALERVPHIKSFGIYGRLHLEDCSYCAGQSYPDEIRTVRQLLINN